MNKTWLPWLLFILALAGGIVSYVVERVDVNTQARGSLYKEYVTRLEYDKDYKSFCERFDNLDRKMDKLIGIVKNDKYGSDR